MPNIGEERGELERVLSEFFTETNSKPTYESLVATFQNASIVELSDEDWSRLENTDSFEHINRGDIHKAREYVEELNKDLPVEYRRDFNRLLTSFEHSKTIECPMIVSFDGHLHLVSGNTRLMISRALGIRPKVLIGIIHP
jgi:hypothetical protein